MEQVANILEKRISSLNAATGRHQDDSGGEGASARLLKSGSLEAAQRPLEETVVITPDRVYHGLTRPEQPRDESQGDASRRPDPAEKWRGCRTVLLFWLCSGIVTLVYSLFWLQIGMLAGVLGIVGSSLSLCGCCSRHRLPLNVHVTRILAVASAGLSAFTALLFLFLLIRLHCPKRVVASGYCHLFTLGMLLTVLWFAFYTAVAGLVSTGATRVIASIDPIGLRRVVVLRPPSMRQSARARSLDRRPSSHGE